jgi:hypothetical protein
MIPSRFKLCRSFSWFDVWGIECGGSDFIPTGRRYRRRVKFGWLSFDLGEYSEHPEQDV